MRPLNRRMAALPVEGRIYTLHSAGATLRRRRASWRARLALTLELAAGATISVVTILWLIGG